MKYVYEFVEEHEDEEEDCENEKDGDDLVVIHGDLDDMCMDLQAVVGTSNNNKRKHSQEEIHIPSKKRKI